MVSSVKSTVVWHTVDSLSSVDDERGCFDSLLDVAVSGRSETDALCSLVSSVVASLRQIDETTELDCCTAARSFRECCRFLVVGDFFAVFSALTCSSSEISGLVSSIMGELVASTAISCLLLSSFFAFSLT